jgi:DNA-binding transcriptional LysR family regulator
MKLDWIDDLLAIADAGSLSGAARTRHLTQPAFSRRIRAIEQLIGSELIDRSSKPINLKPSVLELEPRLREVSQELHTLAYDLSRVNQQHKELVVVGQHAISTAIAPMLIKEVTSNQNLRIRLRSANREDCYSLLFSGQADIGLFYQIEDEQPVESRQFVDTIRLTSDPLVPVISHTHEAQVREDLKNGMLRAVGYPQGVFLGSVFSRHIQPQMDSTITLHWVAETALTTAALQFASIGIGLAWVPMSLAADSITRGELICLEHELPTVSLLVVAMRLGLQRNIVLDETWNILSQYK